PKERKDRIAWLQTKHNLGGGQAGTIVRMMYEGLNDYDESELIKVHFQNGKEYQKDIYNKLLMNVKKFGPHKIAVNKTYFSLIGKVQFAIVKTTKDGMVIGVNAKAVKDAKSKDFIPAKNLGSDKITHKIILNDESELNTSVIKVLKASYDKN
ncbi:MAG: DUF5655 domain-containing protein, partial [Chitinophagales bacterium]|nr:DUF5655 domain-containing protein [Chitinophagales bacterium]